MSRWVLGLFFAFLMVLGFLWWSTHPLVIQGSYNEQLKEALKSLQSHPHSPKLKDELARLFETRGDVGLSVAFYREAVKDNPFSDTAYNELNRALEKWGLPKSPRRYLQLSWLFPLFFVVSSLAILAFFGSSPWLRRFFFSLSGALFFTILWQIYGVASYSSLLSSSYLYQQKDLGAPYAFEQPLPSGMEVKILEISHDKKWVKLQDEGGHIGYVLKEKVL